MQGDASSCSGSFDPLGKVTVMDLHHPNTRLFFDVIRSQLAQFRASGSRVQSKQRNPIRLLNMRELMESPKPVDSFSTLTSSPLWIEPIVRS